MPRPDPETLRRRELEDGRVVEALRRAGVEVNSVYDLVNDRRSFKAAVDPLVEMLPRVQEPAIKEGIVRALTDPAARGIAARPLLDELHRAIQQRDDLLGWTIGNALKVVADDSVKAEILALAQNPTVGGARETLVEALARFRRDSEVREALMKLLEDEEVAGHAIIALRSMNAKESRSAIVPLVDHKTPWVRREAKKALEKLDKQSSKS